MTGDLLLDDWLIDGDLLPRCGRCGAAVDADESLCGRCLAADIRAAERACWLHARAVEARSAAALQTGRLMRCSMLFAAAKYDQLEAGTMSPRRRWPGGIDTPAAGPATVCR